MHSVLRDIRELTDSPEAYAAELRRRWGGLLSYRYIGRSYASMDLGPEDNTVTMRRDMLNTTGGLLFAVLGIAAPESGHMSDLVAVPNPVIHSCQILDAGREVRRIEIVSEELKVGRQMGYSRAKIVDADQPDRVLALIEGQGVSIGTPPGGLERMKANPLEVVDSPDLPPLWQVFGGYRRPDGRWGLPELAVEAASPDAALHIGPQFVILETAAASKGEDKYGYRAEFMERFEDPGVRADVSTDDWPFLYIAARVYPRSYLFMGLVVILLSALLTGNFMRERPAFSHAVFFFLGAGFMLVETKAITEMGLTFGNTWQVIGVAILSILGQDDVP